MIYSIDTSSLIHCWQRQYPPDVFGTLWTNLSAMIQDGGLVASIEVYHELKNKDDSLYEWGKSNKGMFVETDHNIMAVVRNILNTPPYHNIAKNLGAQTEADAFVVAVAVMKEATVITEERRSNSDRRPKIPNVCDGFDVPCINVLEFIRSRGWRF